MSDGDTHESLPKIKAPRKPYIISTRLIKERRCSYFKRSEKDKERTALLNSHTKKLLRYEYTNVISPFQWLNDEVQCPLCGNYFSSFVSTDSDKIKWFKCTYQEHLQFNWQPFTSIPLTQQPQLSSIKKTPTEEWTFSQDSRIRFRGHIYTKHDPMSGKELDDWIIWVPTCPLWQFNVKEETWKQVQIF